MELDMGFIPTLDSIYVYLHPYYCDENSYVNFLKFLYNINMNSKRRDDVTFSMAFIQMLVLV
jgi:hypothetical protein